ncbi:hypothetical protein [Phenylobacterium sp.]|uniref:hypothetical protein n=1 Tax=Phenylobacterium sp. TaxID=1871053 RepID=UPI0035B4588E
MRLSLRAEYRALSRNLTLIEERQLPFAIAQATTALAKHVAKAETDALPSVFDRPSPFTMRAFAVKAARKDNPVAIVFAKDIQARYLEPFLSGGRQVLGSKRAILKPRNIALNAYGNLPRGKLAALKAKPNVFVGKVRLKRGGEVSGVWQRSPSGKGKAGGLKLLIRFADPAPLAPRLHYFERAEKVINAHAGPEFTKALAAALATAR